MVNVITPFFELMPELEEEIAKSEVLAPENIPFGKVLSELLEVPMVVNDDEKDWQI